MILRRRPPGSKPPVIDATTLPPPPPLTEAEAQAAALKSARRKRIGHDMEVFDATVEKPVLPPSLAAKEKDDRPGGRKRQILTELY
jgi:hypothetical protein